jgi:hypothetical protein
MAVTPLRVTGPVLAAETREVFRKVDGERFVFRTASILVANKGVVEVGFREDGPLPPEGALVDYLVSAEVYSGAVKFDYISDFVDPYAASLSSVKADSKVS